MRSRQPLGISNPTSRMTSPDRASTGGCVLESSHTAGRGARVVLEGSSLDVARVGFLHRVKMYTFTAPSVHGAGHNGTHGTVRVGARVSLERAGTWWPHMRNDMHMVHGIQLCTLIAVKL